MGVGLGKLWERQAVPKGLRMKGGGSEKGRVGRGARGGDRTESGIEGICTHGGGGGVHQAR